MSIDINRIGISFPNTAEAQKASNIMETKLVAMGYEVKVSYGTGSGDVRKFRQSGQFVQRLYREVDERYRYDGYRQLEGNRTFQGNVFRGYVRRSRVYDRQL